LAVARRNFSEKAVFANVASRIADLREQRGLTQAALAILMRVELRQAQRYEAGANITLSTVVRLANALGVAPADFFVESERRPRGPGRPTGAKTRNARDVGRKRSAR
jgi:transcriptional regulator with XRE-family HTH domain